MRPAKPNEGANKNELETHNCRQDHIFIRGLSIFTGMGGYYFGGGGRGS